MSAMSLNLLDDFLPLVEFVALMIFAICWLVLQLFAVSERRR